MGRDGKGGYLREGLGGKGGEEGLVGIGSGEMGLGRKGKGGMEKGRREKGDRQEKFKSKIKDLPYLLCCT